MGWDLRQVKVKTGGVMTPNIEEGEVVLQQYASAGWELVTVVPLAKGNGMTYQVYYFFKKPKPVE